MSVRDVAEQIATSPKVAGSVSALTTGSGVGTVFDLIPNDIGKLATLIGIILSVVLIYTHWRRGRIQYEKTRLEIEILRQREAKPPASAANNTSTAAALTIARSKTTPTSPVSRRL